MTTMQPFSLEPLRQAVCSGDFERAQLLWNECAACLADELSGRRLSEARLAEVRELVEWSRNVVSCARAQMQNRINSLHVAGEYEPPVPQGGSRLVSANF